MTDFAPNFPNNSLDAVLKTGLGVISQEQIVTFKKYKRVILPYDGFVFWVLASLLDPNEVNPILNVSGSFHYFTDQKQELASTIAYQNVIFTTDTQIADFNMLQPEYMYLGEFQDLLFSFSSHKNYYEQANLWHYEGQAVYPQMRTQIVDSLDVLNKKDVIVSNSLPIWISLNDYAPIYPSYLVPENVQPPYIACHIDESSTTAIQPIPLYNAEGTWQLMQDSVQLVIYGLNNTDVQNYVQYIVAASWKTGSFGILGDGLRIMDGKHIQSELNTIAQQKFIELDISYNQHAVYNSALEYIESVLPVSLIENVP